MDIFCKKVEQKNEKVLAPGGHNFLGKGPLGLKIVHKKAETELSPKTMVSVSENLLKTPYFQFFLLRRVLRGHSSRLSLFPSLARADGAAPPLK